MGKLFEPAYFDNLSHGHLFFVSDSLYCFLLSIVSVSCCKPPPNLGEKIPGNYWRRPAGPAQGKDHRSEKTGIAAPQRCFYFHVLLVSVNSCSYNTMKALCNQIMTIFINYTSDNCFIIIVFTSWLHDASSLLQHLSAHILVPALLLSLCLHCKQELHVKNVGCACAIALFPNR